MNKLLRKAAAAIAVTGLLASTVLVSAGCSNKQKLIIYNWGEYIAEDTISKFEAAYPQYEVVYRTFETNETMYPNLENGYDVIIPSEYMVCRLIEEDWIQPIDWSKLPLVEQNMDPMFKTLQYAEDKALSDEVLDYAVPYMYCTVGLVYDANKVSIPEGTTEISVAAFKDCKELTSVVIPDSVQVIGALAFAGTNIASIDIPVAVGDIGNLLEIN